MIDYSGRRGKDLAAALLYQDVLDDIQRGAIGLRSLQVMPPGIPCTFLRRRTTAVRSQMGRARLDVTYRETKYHASPARTTKVFKGLGEKSPSFRSSRVTSFLM